MLYISHKNIISRRYHSGIRIIFWVERRVISVPGYREDAADLEERQNSPRRRIHVDLYLRRITLLGVSFLYWLNSLPIPRHLTYKMVT